MLIWTPLYSNVGRRWAGVNRDLVSSPQLRYDSPAGTQTMRDLIGRTLGHYRIVEKIGEGGMGEVYRAHDERLDRDVAIKVLHEAVARDPDRLARFEREAKAVAKLAHLNILEIWDFGREGGVTYAVTELLDGQNLRQSIPTSGMPWQKVIEIGAAIGDGLAAAHGKGIVHRDLKPENVFITSDGRVKILDFGLAQVKEPVEEEAETATLTPAGTVAGTVMGTMGYMSPEQLRGEPSDARSDIFALGCVLYEMLSGKAAFLRKTTAETTAAILKEEPERVSSTGIVLPAEVERSIHRCLEKSPDARFQSASDLAYNLKSISTDQTVVPPPPQRKTRTTMLVGVVAIVLGFVALAVLLGPGLLDRIGSDEETQPIRSIAILPLKNLTGDPEQAYFVDGLHEELIATFAQISAFDKVIARTSVMRFRDSVTSIREIGEQLGVEMVLEGSVRRSEDMVRTTVQLIEASTENHLWAKSFERDLTDILALQSDVARAVADEVELALTPEEEARLAAARTVNPEAHDAYLKGSYHWKKMTPADFDTAERYFELALEKDPSYAPAYEGLAWVWTARQQMGLVPPHEAGPKAKAAAMRALALDDESAGAHEVLAVIKTWIDWDWTGAEVEWQRALELNPKAANAHAYYAHFLAIMGRIDEAVQHSERALELDPVNALFRGLYAAVLYFDRRYDESVAEANTALAMQPDNPAGLGSLWLAATGNGQHTEAFAAAKAYLNVCYADPALEEALEKGWAEGGFTEAMRRAATALGRRFSTSFALPVDIAGFYAMAGEHDEALDWLERGFEVHDPSLPYIDMPVFDPLRSDPRFQDLLRRMNLPED
ncbi:protein kinase [bacterium]|nr:protein kinase [bacterium]